jgi:hypothetical protein
MRLLLGGYPGVAGLMILALLTAKVLVAGNEPELERSFQSLK